MIPTKFWDGDEIVYEHFEFDVLKTRQLMKMLVYTPTKKKP